MHISNAYCEYIESVPDFVGSGTLAIQIVLRFASGLIISILIIFTILLLHCLLYIIESSDVALPLSHSKKKTFVYLGTCIRMRMRILVRKLQREVKKHCGVDTAHYIRIIIIIYDALLILWEWYIWNCRGANARSDMHMLLGMIYIHLCNLLAQRTFIFANTNVFFLLSLCITQKFGLLFMEYFMKILFVSPYS